MCSHTRPAPRTQGMSHSTLYLRAQASAARTLTCSSCAVEPPRSLVSHHPMVGAQWLSLLPEEFWQQRRAAMVMPPGQALRTNAILLSPDLPLRSDVLTLLSALRTCRQYPDLWEAPNELPPTILPEVANHMPVDALLVEG